MGGLEKGNGADYCSSHQLIKEMKTLTEQTQSVVEDNHKVTEHLCHMIDGKFDRLIDVISGKGMVPQDVFKWNTIFILVFVFAVEFGIKGVGQLINLVK